MTDVVLTIDTATPAVSAGIVRRDGDSIDVLAERVTVDPRAHAEQLTPNVLAALADAGIAVTDLDAVVVGCGPGPFTGLRVGMYLSTMRGEYVFTSFDTDDANQYEQFGTRPAGRYLSSCHIPADFFNEGRYSLGVNASSFGVKRYFMDENAVSFNVDISGAPGTQWPEVRQGPIRPRLDWKIEKID